MIERPRRPAEVRQHQEEEPENTRLYEPKQYAYSDEALQRALHGRIVVRGSERPWDMHRQANSKRYLSPHEEELADTAVQDWEVFLQLVPKNSGRHRHQGGLAIFILEGRGYSIFDGVRHDWEAGDLVMLPLKPGGIEHQHFNEHPGGSKWIAFVYRPFWEMTGSQIVQIENSPAYERYISSPQLVEVRGADFAPTVEEAGD